MQTRPMMAAYYPNDVTSDHVQQYLDENKSLILKIVESQNSGKMNECAENQARLQRNLMYLAAIADSQPQLPALHSQYASGGMMQPGALYMQQQQVQRMTQQSLISARSSMLYSQQPYAVMQQQAAALHGQLNMSSGGGTSGGLNILLADISHSGRSGGNLGAIGGLPDFGHNKHEMGSSSSAEGGWGGSSGSGQDDGIGGETQHLKSADNRI